MNYYWFNGVEILQKTKEKYNTCGSREKSDKYYRKNKDVLKEKTKNKYKNMSEKEQEAKNEYNKNKYKEMKKKSNFFSYV